QDTQVDFGVVARVRGEPISKCDVGAGSAGAIRGAARTWEPAFSAVTDQARLTALARARLARPGYRSGVGRVVTGRARAVDGVQEEPALGRRGARTLRGARPAQRRVETAAGEAELGRDSTVDEGDRHVNARPAA